MNNNSHRSGKGLKSMALISLALFVSQGQAKNLGSLQALRDRVPGASQQVKQAVEGIKISSSDPLLEENDDYFEWAEFAVNALQGMSEQEIIELQAEVPELKQLSGPSPFDRKGVTAVIDDFSGQEFSEKDIQDLLEMNKIMQNQYEQHIQKNESHASKHGRKLSAESDIKRGTNHILKVLRSIDPVIYRLIDAYKRMDNYDAAYGAIADAEAATIDPSVQTNLNSADDLKNKGKTKLYTSYRWLKTSSRILYKLLKRIEDVAIKGDFVSMELEEKAEAALETFGKGVSKSEKYIGEAEGYSIQARNKCSLVKNFLNEKKQAALDNVNGKSKEYDEFESTHRAIAYGSCGAICAGTGWMTGGASCVACFGTAAAILETKLAGFREKNEKMMNKYHHMASDMQVVLDRVFEIVKGLNSLDADIKGVGQLIKDARSQYDDIKDTGIIFLTMEAGEPDGTFTEFIEMLERTLNYEENLSKCGTPDCSQTCMQQPIFNESNDYKGCWNQSYRGNKCKNWLAAGAKADKAKGIGNHSSCRNPDPKKYAQAWCYLEDPLEDGTNWEYCVNPTVDPLV